MLMFSLCFSLHRRTLNFFQLSCRQRASDIEKIDFDLEQLIPVEIAGWSPNWLCSLTLCRVVLEGAAGKKKRGCIPQASLHLRGAVPLILTDRMWVEVLHVTSRTKQWRRGHALSKTLKEGRVTRGQKPGTLSDQGTLSPTSTSAMNTDTTDQTFPFVSCLWDDSI